MLYLLALDVGTASAGYTIYLLDENMQPFRLLYGDSRIFSEPTIAQTGELKKAKKRLTKSARKQLVRKGRRYRHMSYLFPLLGLSSSEVSTVSKMKENREKSVLALRAKAVEQEITLPELMRVFMHMQKRRGYAGSFRVKTKDSDKGKAEAGVEQTHAALSTEETVGQYLYERYQKGESTKNVYALRDDYQKEFDRIWNTQMEYHDVLKRCDSDGVSIKERFKEAIFKQLPIQGFSNKVGKCPLIEGEIRAPKAHPIFQEFRIQETLNNLSWGRKGKGLALEQRSVIEQMLTRKTEVSFDTIYKQLKKNGDMPETGVCLNMDTPNRDVIHGNSTLAGFKTLKLEDVWLDLDDETQDAVIRFLADMTTPELPDIPGWREQTTPEAADFIDKMVDTGKFNRLSKMRNFESGRASYSVEAMQQMLPLIRKGERTEEVVARLFPDDDFVPLGYLPMLEDTGNALVDVAMKQVKVVVDEIYTCLGNPAQVIVEMGREMGVGAEQKKNRERQQAKNRTANRSLNEELIEGDHKPARENRLRLQLWKEQGGDPNLSEAKIAHCIYSGKPITLSDALDGHSTQIDHIRPRKRFFDTRRPQYLTLCVAKANKFKGDRTPWEAFHDSPEANGIHYDWDDLQARVKQLPRDARFKKKLLLSKVTEAQEENEFVDRQMHATRWVARLTGQWMKHICPDVWTSKGWLTAQLRRQWGLETVIDEVRRAEGLPLCKNKFGEWSKRMDHRHHFIDACVIGLTSRSLFQKAAKAFRDQAGHADNWNDIEFKADPPIEVQVLRRQVLDVCRKMVVSHKPDRFLSAKLFGDNPFGLQSTIEGDEERKWLTHRVPVIDLVSKTTKNGREALPETTARKNLEHVAGKELQTLLLDKLDECLLEDIPFQQGFANLRRYTSEKSPPIKLVKIRVTKFDSESHQIIEHRQAQLPGKRYKVLQSVENAYVEVKEEDDGVDVKVVPMFKALAAGKPGKRICRFFKGDMVKTSADTQVYVIQKIARPSDSKPVRIWLIPHTESRTVGGNADYAGMKSSDGLVVVRGDDAQYLRIFHTTPAGLKPVIGKLLRE